MALPGTDGRRRIYLMRHGAVSYVDAGGRPINPLDVPLTAEGREQAAAARDLMAGIALDRALCSGLPRARETAEIVLAPHGLDLEEDTGFRELRGARLSTIAPERREALFVYGLERAHEPGARFAEGDLFADFEDRIAGALEACLAQPGWTRMLLVAHDAVNRMILSLVSGAGLAGLGAFEQDFGCINVIDVDIADGQPVRRLIKAVNVTPYNPAKHGNYHTSFEQVFHSLGIGVRNE